MARRASRRVWVVLFCLTTTFIFWGLLQSQVELGDYGMPLDADTEHSHNIHHRPLPRSKIRPRRNLIQTLIKTGERKFKVIPGGTSPKFMSPNATRLFPELHERQDRILPQINLLPDDPQYMDKEHMKLILLYNGLPDDIPDGDKKFQIDGCPVRNCYLTSNRHNQAAAHAVVYEGGVYHEPKRHSPDQIFVIYILESPENVADLKGQFNWYNWTATYRLDSTINTPYERFIPYANSTNPLPLPKRNYAKGKTKKVAWFVSNCYATNKRSAYADELAKYINVDVYGACGNMTCFRSDKEQCDEILNKDYKFYLAFENSNCRDYISEKFYWNALYNDIVPIAMGARPEDYKAVSPPGSYIHVDDFESPRHLAAYLHKLDRHDKLYNEYFRWKGTGEFIDTKYWCRLCSMVHQSYSDKSSTMWYDNIDRWWNGPGVCIHPGPDEKWASWRNYDCSASDRVVAGRDTVHVSKRDI